MSLQSVLEAERAEFRAEMKSMQYVLDQKVKENQRREEVIWQQEAGLRRLKAKIDRLNRGITTLVDVCHSSVSKPFSVALLLLHTVSVSDCVLFVKIFSSSSPFCASDFVIFTIIITQ